jgi:hypothetical protein
MITILSGLELEVEISTFGIGGEEGGVLLSGNIEVLIDLSTLFKLQFQHLLLRSIADAGNTAGVYRNSLHTFLDADESTKYQMRKTQSGIVHAGWRFRLIRIDGSSDPGAETEMVSGIGSCPSLSTNTLRLWKKAEQEDL